MKTYRKLRRWHRTFGVIASLFVILLVLTGLMLNHTETLKLDQKYIGSSLLLDWYNIEIPTDPVSFATENHRISLLGNRLYLDALELEDRAEVLYGAIEFDNSVVVAIPGEILLLDQDGEMIEKISEVEGIPEGLQRIGLSPENDLIVKGSQGEYMVDLDALKWNKKQMGGTSWSEPSALSEPLKTTLSKAYRGKGLPVERFMLDLHSGRILGGFGVFLIDAAALLFLILAITGVWMWTRSRK